LSLKASAKQL
jgi:nuclear migration protein JNM1